MATTKCFPILCALVLAGMAAPANAVWTGGSEGCVAGAQPVYENVLIDMVSLQGPIQVPAVLTRPVEWVRTGRFGGCFKPVANPPAVVFLHGSGGIGNREGFYARALQRQYATLTIEMFKGTLSGTGTGRPPLPFFNYSYAMGALKFLIEEVGAREDGVGCVGFSWGGVVCQQLAMEKYAQEFGDDLYGGAQHRFAAHVAHYPSCWLRYRPGVSDQTRAVLGILEGGLGTSELGLDFGDYDGDQLPDLTSAPVLVQVGSEDAYDNAPGESGSASCVALASSVAPPEQGLVEVNVIAGATHAYDAVFTVPSVVNDPFARRGECIASGAGACLGDPATAPEVVIEPNQDAAIASLHAIRRFFRDHLRQ